MDIYHAVRDFIRDLGFPIFVACYFLLSLRPEVSRMRRSLDRLYFRMTGESVEEAEKREVA